MSEMKFRCPYCGQKLCGEAEDVGADAECPSCGKVFRLEAAMDGDVKRPNVFMCYIGIFRRYFDFKSRMGRREYWWAFLFWWIVYLLSAFVDGMIWGELNWCCAAVSLGTSIPLMAAQVRRLHDTNKRGWWLPLMLLTPINIAYFVWLASAGDRGPNRFGEDPKGW